MDLSPLYELRERLKTGAIAGTGLIRDDFRLQRALEALAPLEAASPVFARLGAAVRDVLAPDCADSAGALLDTLSLCDALLTTQASTKATAPEVALPIYPYGSAQTQAPYSLLAPLLDALTTSGSGKAAIVTDAHQNTPALFADYRVKHALVDALGASYADLAELVARWLLEETPAILPLLKAGFDPKGKKEMVRRLRIMDQIAGGAENDFYLSLLETGEKDVKATAAYALRHKEENAETLIHLAKTEKSPINKMAQMALATMHSPAVHSFWEASFATKPEQAAKYMFLSKSAKGSQCVGAALSAQLTAIQAANFTFTKQGYATLQSLLLALPGKSGAEICAFYAQAAAIGTKLDNVMDEKKKPYTFMTGESYYNYHAQAFSENIPHLLTCSLIANPTEDLLQLAKQLWEQYGLCYAPPAVAAALISTDAATAYEAALPIINPSLKLLGISKEYKETHKHLCQLLQRLEWEKGDANAPAALCMTMYDFNSEQSSNIKQPLAAPLDNRWYTTLLKNEGAYDPFFLEALYPEDEAIRQAVGQYMHKRCLVKAEHIAYIPVLARLGWTDYKGLFQRFCEHINFVDGWEVQRYLRELPISSIEKRKELEWLLQQVTEKKIKVRNRYTTEQLTRLLEEYRTHETAETEAATQQATHAE